MSRFTRALVEVKKKLKWPENKSVGYSRFDRKDKYLNPLLTPPPRSPKGAEDFRHPQKLGHWRPLGMDFTSPVADKYYYHEFLFGTVCLATVFVYLFINLPNFKNNEWALREAFLRAHKREALGLPYIDLDVVDAERVVLPTEEELENFPVNL